MTVKKMHHNAFGLACLFWLFISASGTVAQTTNQPQTNDPSDHLVSVWRVIDAFNESDIEALASHFAGSATADRGDNNVIDGADAIVSFVQEFLLAFPDAYLIPIQVLAVGPSTVLVEWILEGTHLGAWSAPGREDAIPATGRTVRFTGAVLVGFDASGEIDRNEIRIDMATFLSQMQAASSMDRQNGQIQELAERYTAAWNSQDPSSVAAFFSEDGSLTINGGDPSEGRDAIAAVAEGFMTAFPDMQLLMDGLHVQGDRAVYQWTFSGTNSGPGGTEKSVRFSGFEVWQIGADGLILESRGYFDSALYQSQLEAGAD